MCGKCAGIPKDFHCTRCGEEDEPHRRGLCARCCLRDDLSNILEDPNGDVRPELVPLFDALCSQQRPRAALLWSRKPEVQRLLRGFADGSLPIRHETLNNSERPRIAEHMRELLAHHGVLPEQNKVIHQFQTWREPKLAAYPAEVRRVLRSFSTWHQLRGMRNRAVRGTLKAGAGLHAKQELTIAGNLLMHLHDTAGHLGGVRQEHLDGWLATGPSTRYKARTFILWAGRTKHLPSLRVPQRKAASTPVMAQDERLALLRRCFAGDSDIALPYRVATALLLLYAQPVTRICRLRVHDVVTTGDVIGIHLGKEPTTLPAPVAELLREHVDNRPHMTTAANADAAWLFPGRCPGQPLTQSQLMTGIRQTGVHLLGGRNAALRQLVLDMPPALAAEALGYHPSVTQSHAEGAGTTWVTYASYRRLAVSDASTAT